MTEDSNHEKQWDDLRPEIRAEIIAVAEDRLWWKTLNQKLGWLGKLAGVLITLAAVYTLFREGLHAWLSNLANPRG
ncbi:MAG: hypothetical protein AAFN44_03380 [Pseudomonadota bacterium]